MTLELSDEEMLADMLRDDGLLFLSGNCGPFFQAEAPDATPVSVHVNCNDVFAAGCADAEPLPIDQIGEVYAALKNGGSDGVLLWSCLRRGMRPQSAIERRMRDAGTWTKEFEALPQRKKSP